MASPETWAKLKYFKPDSKIDNWGNPDAINDEILYALDSFRDIIRSPIIVTSGTGGKHSTNSFHYERNGACAVDIICPYWTKNPVEILLTALRLPFRGVGYYPKWKWQGQVKGGLHLDMRSLKDSVPKTVTWMEGDGKYIALNWKHLMLYGGKNG